MEKLGGQIGMNNFVEKMDRRSGCKNSFNNCVKKSCEKLSEKMGGQIVQCTLYSLQSALHSVQCTVSSVQCTMYSVNVQ